MEAYINTCLKLYMCILMGFKQILSLRAHIKRNYLFLYIWLLHLFVKEIKSGLTYFFKQFYCLSLEYRIHYILFPKMKYLSTNLQPNHITLKVTTLVTHLMETQRRACEQLA